MKQQLFWRIERKDKASKSELEQTKKAREGISMATKMATKQSALLEPETEVKKGPKTRIVVRYNVGFENHLTLRGKGANLSWDKGIILKNVKHDEWVWETEVPFNTCEFKVLINDSHYELGENHPISCGASIQYTPKF